MSLDLGLHFIVGLSGTKLSDLDKKILEEVRPAGVLLLKRNFLQNAPYHQWLTELDNLYTALKSFTGRDNLMITLDHEGGRVHRTPAPITHFSDAASYVHKAYETAQAMAVELRSIGVNISWAPCTDIHSNPANPVIGTRSFGATAQIVSDAASAYARGLMENGVLACAKHFPGHGDTNVDSHLALPTLDLTLEELRTRELIPFKRLIDEGVPLVMTSHILFPKIDPENPATLSHTILNGLLRQELGFGGIIVTDDLDMKAVADRYTTEDLVARAVNSGCELFIVARFPDGTSEKPLLMHAGLQSALKAGTVDPALLEVAEEKIRYLMAHGLQNPKVHELPVAVYAEHDALKQRA